MSGCSPRPRWRACSGSTPKTVTRWAKAGKLTSIRTLGGHRRYRAAEVEALLAGLPAQRQPPGDDTESRAGRSEPDGTPPVLSPPGSPPSR